MALAGHSGTQTAQSMHSSGSMVRKFGPSRKQSTGQTSTQSVYLQRIQASVTTWVMVTEIRQTERRDFTAPAVAAGLVLADGPVGLGETAPRGRVFSAPAGHPRCGGSPCPPAPANPARAIRRRAGWPAVPAA